MARPRHSLPWILRVLTSLQFTIACLAMLMALVVLCTLAQVRLGTFEAVKIYFRSLFLYWTPPGTHWKLPVFPAGGLVGAVLLINLVASHLYRLELSRRKLGLWIIHAGLVLLFLGEFATGFFAIESMMPIDEGATRNYTENPRETELAVIDASDPAFDQVYGIPERVFGKKARIEHPDLPFTLLVKKYYANSELEMRPAGDNGPPSMATAGPGARAIVFERPAVATDDQANQVSAFVEIVNGDRSLGTWLLSNALGEAQSFRYLDKTYRLAIRQTRYYLPFSITLKKFKHDVYAGTDIPRNFSSLIHLSDPSRREDRDALIYMNHPLRYGGQTFYQASFGKNDTQSIFQVVRNPGWLLPYVACALLALGLIIHFCMQLTGFIKTA